jgi:GT2 family glycosyltransferase
VSVTVPRVGVIVLSQGRRPDGLAASLRSVLRQEGVVIDAVVVGNGWAPTGLPDGVRGVHLPENLGIPAGRNAGVPHVIGETLFFLDDDETVPSATFLADCLALMRSSGDVALIQPRIVDPTGAVTPRRWIPRIRKGDPAASSAVFSVLEGAVVVRRDAFEAADGWAGEFFYAHEGIELAWRIWDQGLRAWYAGDRVWLARRNLPLPLVPVYVGSWTAVQLIRSARNRDGLATWLRGWREGWTTSPGERRPLSWGTVLRMTRAGRPPVI